MENVKSNPQNNNFNNNQIVSLIWNIADDVLRDVFLRGQYRDVILPMVVLRRLDALLEPTKSGVEKELAELDPGENPDEGDKTFYKEYKDSEAFKYGTRKAVRGIIANRDYTQMG